MDEKNKVRLKYYECNMTKGQHVLAYLFFSVMIGVVLFIYYRFIPVAVIGGFIIGIWQEKNYSYRFPVKMNDGNSIRKL